MDFAGGHAISWAMVIGNHTACVFIQIQAIDNTKYVRLSIVNCVERGLLQHVH